MVRTTNGEIEFVCPEDAAPLRRESGAYACPRCQARFPVQAGVVRFLEQQDAFYESRYLYTVKFVPRSESPLFAWPLWLMNSGYVWAVRKHVPAGSTIVEMGCASGMAYFASRYRVIGLDLSFGSLVRVAELYGACMQADATRSIPLPDASVDAVISSYVWEHIPPEKKPDVLAECRRVLRPGGRLVFLYDVECDNPLFRRMKRVDPALYREVLIDREGHHGWQTPRENLELFERSNFRVCQQLGRERLFISPAMYDKVANWPGALRSIGRLGMRLRSGLVFQGYNAALRSFDETLGRLLPEGWSRVAVTVCAAQPD